MLIYTIFLQIPTAASLSQMGVICSVDTIYYTIRGIVGTGLYYWIFSILLKFHHILQNQTQILSRINQGLNSNVIDPNLVSNFFQVKLNLEAVYNHFGFVLLIYFVVAFLILLNTFNYARVFTHLDINYYFRAVIYSYCTVAHFLPIIFWTSFDVRKQVSSIDSCTPNMTLACAAFREK